MIENACFIKWCYTVMKKRALTIILSVLLLFSLVSATAYADDDFLFTVDVNEQYTDISYIDETNALGEVETDEYEQELKNKKTVYIVVLSVLLVASVAVLVVTLKKAERGELLKDKDDEEINNS